MFGTHIGSSNDLYIVVIITVKNKCTDSYAQGMTSKYKQTYDFYIIASKSVDDYNTVFPPAGRAVKQCTLNGTWYEKNGMAWTDYTACLDREVSGR